MNKFVIAGVQRSGTTMLSVMLERHKDIFMEPQVMSFKLISCYQNMIDLLPYNGDVDLQDFMEWIVQSDKTGRMLDLLNTNLLTTDMSFQDLVNTSIANRASTDSKIVWGDKAPNIQHYISDLLMLIPGTKVIHIVRDGRAVAASMSKRAYRNVSLCAQSWVNGCTTGVVNKAILGDENYLIIRYEDLLTDPERSMRSVCSFIGLEYDPNVIALGEIEANDKSYVKQFFDLKKIDDWKTSISKQNLRKIEQIQKQMLKEFGYELENQEISFKPLKTFKQLRLNLWDFFLSLFQGKKQGMRNRELIIYKDSFKSKLGKFIVRSLQEIVSLKIHKALFSKRYYRSKTFERSNDQ